MQITVTLKPLPTPPKRFSKRVESAQPLAKPHIPSAENAPTIPISPQCVLSPSRCYILCDADYSHCVKAPTQLTPPVPVLFTTPDSIYNALPHADPYDQARDANTYAGSSPIIAHPPCQQWSTMRHFANHNPQQKALAIYAVALVRRLGGILEHPAASDLWPSLALPVSGGLPDHHGGYTIQVDQFHWGHAARKRTWLYIVGCNREYLPPRPHRTGSPTHVYGTTKGIGRLPTVPHSLRNRTPLGFALWLLAIVQQIPHGTLTTDRTSQERRIRRTPPSLLSSVQTLETS